MSAAETPARAEWVAFISWRTEPKKPKDRSSTISAPEKDSSPVSSCPAASTAATATEA